MSKFRVISDEHSNHGLPIGSVVERLPAETVAALAEEDYADPDVEYFTQGIVGDERAIDPRDLEPVDD